MLCCSQRRTCDASREYIRRRGADSSNIPPLLHLTLLPLTHNPNFFCEFKPRNFFSYPLILKTLDRTVLSVVRPINFASHDSYQQIKNQLRHTNPHSLNPSRSSLISCLRALTFPLDLTIEYHLTFLFFVRFAESCSASMYLSLRDPLRPFASYTPPRWRALLNARGN